MMTTTLTLSPAGTVAGRLVGFAADRVAGLLPATAGFSTGGLGFFAAAATAISGAKAAAAARVRRTARLRRRMDRSSVAGFARLSSAAGRRFAAGRRETARRAGLACYNAPNDRPHRLH